jgi:hypothetical protein
LPTFICNGCVRRWLKARDREEHSQSRRSTIRLSATPSIEIGENRQGEQGDDLRKLLRCEEDKDISLLIKATKPASYAIEKAPPEGAEQVLVREARRESLRPGCKREQAPAKVKRREWKTNRHLFVTFSSAFAPCANARCRLLSGSIAGQFAAMLPAESWRKTCESLQQIYAPKKEDARRFGPRGIFANA